MSHSTLGKRGGMTLGLNRDRQTGPSRRPVRVTCVLEALEDRLVQSAGASLTSGVAVPSAAVGSANSSTSASSSVNLGQILGSFTGFAQGALPTLGGGAAILTIDAAKTDKAFGNLAASIQSSVSSLRLTATTTTAPTAAGLTTFNSAVDSAIATLNTSLGTVLKNLPQTKAALMTTLNGYTATLQDELKSAATGLKNGSNSAVLAMTKEIANDEATVQHQVSLAIRNDLPTGTIAGSKGKALNLALVTAVQNFNSSVNATSLQGLVNSKSLDTTSVGSAVTTLSGALNSAIAALPAAFSASKFNPTSTLATQLTTLKNDLSAIAAPSSTNILSTLSFVYSVNMVMNTDGKAIDQTLASSIDGYNQSLL